jgi:hypothetical protein
MVTPLKTPTPVTKNFRLSNVCQSTSRGIDDALDVDAAAMCGVACDVSLVGAIVAGALGGERACTTGENVSAISPQSEKFKRRFHSAFTCVDANEFEIERSQTLSADDYDRFRDARRAKRARSSRIASSRAAARRPRRKATRKYYDKSVRRSRRYIVSRSTHTNA